MNKIFCPALRIIAVIFPAMILSANSSAQQQDIIVKEKTTYDFIGRDSTLNNRIVTIFDTDTNILSEIKYLGHTKDAKKDYIYDPQGRLIRLMSYKYYTAYDAWWPNRLEEYSYDTYGYVNDHITYLWNQNEKKFEPLEKNIQEHDSAGNWTLSIRYNWFPDLNDWKAYDKLEMFYDREGHDTLHISSIWNADSSKWIFNRKLERSYNGAGRAVQEISYEWDTVTNHWIGSIKVDSTFEDDVKIMTVEISTWQKDSSLWRPYGRYEYSYDPLGYTSNKLYFLWDTTTASWVNFKKDEFINDPAGNVVSHVYYKWNADSTNWQKRSYEIYEYDNNEMIILKESYVLDLYENRWRGNYKYTYVYDEDRRLVLFHNYSWNSSDSTFTDYERISYSYDPSGMIKAKLTDHYMNWANGYMPYEHIFYTVSNHKMDIRNTCEGDSAYWYDNYYTEGIYMETIPSAEGNDSVVFLSVSEFPRPGPFRIAGDSAVNLTEVYLYTAPSDSSKNYEWLVENGTILTGQGEDSITVQWDSTGTGKVKAWTTVGGGCTSDTASLTVNIYISGISDPLQNILYIYPNPAHDLLQIQNLTKEYNYRIINLSGRILQAGKIQVNGMISVASLPPGTYYLNLMHSQKCIINKKFVKQ